MLTRCFVKLRKLSWSTTRTGRMLNLQRADTHSTWERICRTAIRLCSRSMSWKPRLSLSSMHQATLRLHQVKIPVQNLSRVCLRRTSITSRYRTLAFTFQSGLRMVSGTIHEQHFYTAFKGKSSLLISQGTIPTSIRNVYWGKLYLSLEPSISCSGAVRSGICVSFPAQITTSAWSSNWVSISRTSSKSLLKQWKITLSS